MISETLLMLADRAEKATGEDRQLDAEISIALGLPTEANATLRYTSSIDAAWTIVPDDYVVQLSNWDNDILRAKGPWQAIIVPRGQRGMMNSGFTNRCEHAASPAIAVTVAALRAIAFGMITTE